MTNIMLENIAERSFELEAIDEFLTEEMRKGDEYAEYYEVVKEP